MPTLVCFHAHPDDEAITTSGTMAKAAEAGHRVVLVVATRGEHGGVVEGVLEPGEQLGIRRVAETFASAALIGCHRVEFLGYVDSGMMGDPTNDAPYSFWSADLDRASHRFACILREERRGGEVVLTVYDDNGGYGHPDHIKVHRVGMRAAELAGVEHVFQVTMNRDQITRNLARIAQEDPGFDLPDVGEEGGFGKPETEITHAVDVVEHLDVKRGCMRAHASQIPDDSFFLSLPEDAFSEAFGTEWYIEHGKARPQGHPFARDLFEGLT